MTTIHRELDGRWAECDDTNTCNLKFHVPDMSIGDALDLPENQLWPLFEIMDPPVTTDAEGCKTWSIWLGRKQVIHRDYDLPARTHPRDNFNRPIAEWCYKGLNHRGNDLPAVIWSDGTLEWYHLGHRHREGNKPAHVYPDGRVEYWDMGNRTA